MSHPAGWVLNGGRWQNGRGMAQVPPDQLLSAASAQLSCVFLASGGASLSSLAPDCNSGSVSAHGSSVCAASISALGLPLSRGADCTGEGERCQDPIQAWRGGMVRRAHRGLAEEASGDGTTGTTVLCGKRRTMLISGIRCLSLTLISPGSFAPR